MTIAAGFLGKDGAVLCADTQLTIPGMLKYPESKVVAFKEHRWQPVFVYAGDPAFSKASIARLAEKIAQNDLARPDLFHTIAEECKKIHEEFYPLYEQPSDKLELSLLFALRTSPVSLFQVRGPVLARLESYECLGAGTYLARAIASDFYQPTMPCREIVKMAAYLLMKVKTHVDYCGGTSQIFVISDPEEDFLDLEAWGVYTEEVERPERMFTDFQMASSLVMLALPDAATQPAAFEANWDKLKGVIRECRNRLLEDRRKAEDEARRLLGRLTDKKKDESDDHGR